MFCAACAAEKGLKTAVAEHEKYLGRKLGITGKGRCNVTNNCDRDTALKNIIRNPRFLYSALSKCSPADVMEYFEGLGVPLKTERGQRVFPVSDRAGDVVSALERRLKQLEVTVIKGNCTKLLISDGECRGAVVSGREVRAGAVVLATGGMSYPATGSDGSGYGLARQAGHTIIPCQPSLVPLETEERWVAHAAGLDLRNISMKLLHDGKPVYEDFGELMFMAYGVGGPTILSASAHIGDITSGGWAVEIDLKPALSEKQLDSRILRDFTERRGMRFADSLRGDRRLRGLSPGAACPGDCGAVRYPGGQKGGRGDQGRTPGAGRTAETPHPACHEIPPDRRGDNHPGRRVHKGDKPKHHGKPPVPGAVFRRGDYRLRRAHRWIQFADSVLNRVCGGGGGRGVLNRL